MGGCVEKRRENEEKGKRGGGKESRKKGRKRVSLITGLLITGLDWTGIHKFVFTHCGMQFPRIIILELPCSRDAFQL